MPDDDIKPSQWVFSRSAVGAEWQWFWDRVVVAVPLWEQAGAAFDVSPNKTKLSLVGTPDRRPTKHGSGLRCDAVTDSAQVTTPEFAKIGWPMTLFVGHVHLGLPSSFISIFGMHHNSTGGFPFMSCGLVDSQNPAGNMSIALNHGGTFLNLDSLGHIVAYPAVGAHRNDAGVISPGNQRYYTDGVLRFTSTDALSGGDPTYNATSLLGFGDGVFSSRNPNRIYTYGYILKGAATTAEVQQIHRDPFGPFRLRDDVGVTLAAGPVVQTVSVVDGFQLDDVRRGVTELLQLENLQLKEDMFSQIDKQILDLLFLFDFGLGPVWKSNGAGDNGNAVSSLNWSHTIDECPNRFVVIAIGWADTNTEISGFSDVTSVTVGGKQAYRLGYFRENASDLHHITLFGVTAPDTGAQTVSVTFHGSVLDAAANSSVFANVDQDVPYTNVNAVDGNSTGPSVILTSADPGGVGKRFIGAAYHDATPTISLDSGDGDREEHWQEDPPSNDGTTTLASMFASGDGIFNWTLSSAEEWIAFGAILNEVGSNEKSIIVESVGAGAGNTSFPQTSINWSHEIAGSNRYIIIGISINDSDAGSPTVSTVTIGAGNATKLGSDDSASGNSRFELWGLKAPSTGSQTVTVTLTESANEGLVANSINFTGVDQGTPTGSVATSVVEQGNAAISLNVTTTADDVAVAGLYVDFVHPVVPDAGQTPWTGNRASNGDVMATLDTKPAAGTTTTFGWTEDAGGGTESVKIAVGISLKVAVSTLVERSATEGVFLNDFRTSILGALKRDQTPLSDEHRSTLSKTIQAFLLLKDTTNTQKLKNILATDEVFIKDNRFQEQAKSFLDNTLLTDFERRSVAALKGDQVLVSDTRTSVVQKIFSDPVFLDDNTLVSKLTQLIAIDQVLLRDVRFSEDQKFIIDTLLMNDFRNSLVDKIISDNLLLSDSFVADKAKELIFTDGLLLNDARLSSIDKAIVDQILLIDFVTRAINKVISEGLFVSDSVVSEIDTSKIFTVAIQDGILLFDTVLRSIDKFIPDSVLLNDEDFRETLKSFTDSVLTKDGRFSTQDDNIADNVLVTENLHKTLEKLISDNTLITDDLLRSMDKVVEDTVLLRDNTLLSTGRFRLVEDGVLLFDSTRKSIDLSALDKLLLNDLIAKTYDKLIGEGVFLVDSVTRTVIESVTQALIWALIRARDFLGLQISANENFLGCGCDTVDNLLSILASYHRQRDFFS